jgi:hypothetical protein
MLMSAIPDLLTADLKEIQNYVESEVGQDEIQFLTDYLREEVGSPEKYLSVCQRVKPKVNVVEVVWSVLERMERLIQNCPPGHDRFHILRDLLHAVTLVGTDPFVAKAAYQEDIVASLLGGAFHDIGNAVTHRYQDRARRAGHAEIGAWMFFRVTEDLLPENVRLLASYSIAAHTDYRAPIKVQTPEGFERQPYWYGIEYLDGRPYGLAPILTRFADRLDTNGVTHFCRHLLAQADAVEFGGYDLTGDAFFEINQKALDMLFVPDFSISEDNHPTALRHCKNFALSNFGGGYYCRNDHLFPVMVDLMWGKVSQIHELARQVMDREIPVGGFLSLGEADELVACVLRDISGSPHFDRSWQVLAKSWNALNREVQVQWLKGFKYVLTAYFEWLDQVVDLASTNEDYRSLVGEIRRELTFKSISLL